MTDVWCRMGDPREYAVPAVEIARRQAVLIETTREFLADRATLAQLARASADLAAVEPF